MVATKQKTTVDTQKIMRKEFRHTIKENHQIPKEEKNYKTARNKTIIITAIKTNISITANVNAVNSYKQK